MTTHKLVITLEMAKTGNSPYYMGQRLELIRRCLNDGVTHGVIVSTYDSKVSGAWALEPIPDEEEIEK